MTKLQILLARIAMIPVIAAAAWNSYWHTVHVALAYGQDTMSAHMLPLSVDGLMLVASLIVSHAARTRSKVVAWITLTVGFLASFAANMLATDGGVIAHVVSGWYALSLLLGAELVQHISKRAVTRRPARKPAKKTAPASKTVPAKKATKTVSNPARATRTRNAVPAAA